MTTASTPTDKTPTKLTRPKSGRPTYQRPEPGRKKFRVKASVTFLGADAALFGSPSVGDDSLVTLCEVATGTETSAPHAGQPDSPMLRAHLSCTGELQAWQIRASSSLGMRSPQRTQFWPTNCAIPCSSVIENCSSTTDDPDGWPYRAARRVFRAVPGRSYGSGVRTHSPVETLFST